MTVSNNDLTRLEQEYRVSMSRYRYSIDRLNENISLLKGVKAQYKKGILKHACYQSYKTQTSVTRNAMYTVIEMNKERLKESKKAYHNAKNNYAKQNHELKLKQFEQLIHSMDIEQVQLLQEYKHLIKGY